MLPTVQGFAAAVWVWHQTRAQVRVRNYHVTKPDMSVRVVTRTAPQTAVLVARFELDCCSILQVQQLLPKFSI